MEQIQPKVSVIMPSLNVARYIRQCLDSVLNQTLRDMEILCVDAGSVDGTLAILREYAARDSRIRVLLSDRKSYGYQMNLGLDAAKGEYIGIVETDDWAEPDMFEALYACAEEHDLDMAKAGYYLYRSMPAEQNTVYDFTLPAVRDLTFCPVRDLSDTPHTLTELLTKNHSIWSAVYRRSFLVSNGIRFMETPGAAFQDTAFAMKVWCTADRVRILDRALLHYRTDNVQSSVHAQDKLFCICDEYDEAVSFLKVHALWNENVPALLSLVRYSGYVWNFHRLHGSDAAQEAFLLRFYQDFRAISDRGELEESFFTPDKWQDLQLLLRDPNAFYQKLLCDYYRIRYHQKSRRYKAAGPVTRIRLSKAQKTILRIRAFFPYLISHGPRKVFDRMHRRSSRV